MAGLRGQTFDFIHSGSFFHLFTWEEQVEVISKAVSLLKQKHGSLIFGRQVGVKEAGPWPDFKVRSGPMYRHNEESLKKLVQEVSNSTGVKLEAEVDLSDVKQALSERTKSDVRYLSFVIRYVE